MELDDDQGGSNSEAPRSRQSRYWQKVEHERFLEALKLYDLKDVQSISAHVGTRTPTQVRTHAQKWLLKQKRESQSNQQGSDATPIVVGETVGASPFYRPQLQFTPQHQHLQSPNNQPGGVPRGTQVVQAQVPKARVKKYPEGAPTALEHSQPTTAPTPSLLKVKLHPLEVAPSGGLGSSGGAWAIQISQKETR